MLLNAAVPTQGENVPLLVVANKELQMLQKADSFCNHMITMLQGNKYRVDLPFLVRKISYRGV